ncbi:MAG: LPS export ABC transporter periplasmic protein LptC, partial [Blastocatellia bacterium]|nr:LPS export ABC transporter periplasmic protein LptC [Blastocatellia bacterium]
MMIRSRLPLIAKIIAIIVFLGVTIQLAINLVTRVNITPNQTEKKSTQLQGQLVADFNSFKYVHHEGNRNRYILTAAKDKVFGDGHHELLDVKLETFDSAGAPSGFITSKTCLYDQSKAQVQFEGDVYVETSDGLKVKSNKLNYNQQTEQADSPEKVEFERDRIKGSCEGMFLDSRLQRLQMNSKVDITIEPKSAEEEESENNSKGKNSDKKEKPQPSLSKDHKENKKKNKEKEPDPKENSIEITGNWAEYDGKNRTIKLRGLAKIAEPDRSLSASAMTAFLFAKEDKIERLEARGESLIDSKKPELYGQIRAKEIDFHFDSTSSLTKAEARGEAEVDSVGQADRHLKADKLEVTTTPGVSGNEIQNLRAWGNVWLKLDAPVATSSSPNPSQKELTTEELELSYQPGGKFPERAEARKEVVLKVLPVQQVDGAESRSMESQKATLVFYENSSAAQKLLAEGRVKLISTSYGAVPRVRTTESNRAEALFSKETGDITKAIQEGSFKYNESERNAQSELAVYDSLEEKIELRGGKVAVWDNKARTQADEIDLLTLKQESFARGHVRSTYYSPTSTGQAAPFQNMQSPIFITANESHSFNKRGEITYTGDARAWQEDNFVRADKIELYKDGQRMVATGNVSSALWKTGKKGLRQAKDQTQTVPVFASAESLTYSDRDRIVEYRTGVKVNQGVDKLEAEQVKIFLSKNNEIERMEAHDKVIITQPGRRAEGDRAEYNAAEDRTVIAGNSAKVYSDQQG